MSRLFVNATSLQELMAILLMAGPIASCAHVLLVCAALTQAFGLMQGPAQFYIVFSSFAAS